MFLVPLLLSFFLEMVPLANTKPFWSSWIWNYWF